MKKFIFFAILFSLGLSVKVFAFTPVTGFDMMERLGLGYTFANSTEARVWPWEDRTVENSEDAWGQPRIREWHLRSIALKGFDSYRMCVTWTPNMDGNYVIDPVWMNRIQEIADWALGAGLNVIINTHHEEELYELIRANDFVTAERYLNAIWTQVAERFKDYPEGLLFEIMNEPNLLEYYGGPGHWVYCEEHRAAVCPDLVSMTNRLDASALNVIRNSGGNNAERVVILTTAGATVQGIPLVQIPANDPYIMVGAFGYPGGFISDSTFRHIQNLVSRGIGFINKEDAFTSDDEAVGRNTARFARNHFARLAQLGVPSFWFAGCRSTSNGAESHFFNRVTGEWENSELLSAIFEAYGKTPGPDFALSSTRTRLYSLADDSRIQGLSAGTTSGILARPLSGGGGDFEIVARTNGGNAIQMTNRTNPWSSIDISRPQLNINLNANDYLIIVRGRVVNAARNQENIISMNGADSPWNEIATATITGNGEFTLTAAIGATHGVSNPQQFANAFRIQTRNVTPDIIIDDIIVEREGGEPEPTPTPTPAPASPAPTPAPTDSDVIIHLTIGDTQAIVDGIPIELTAAPYIGDGNRTMVPVRFIVEAMGAEIGWSEPVGVVTITIQGREIRLTVGQELPDEMGTPEIVEGRTFVPVRFVADAMGASVEWDGDTQTVRVIVKRNFLNTEKPLEISYDTKTNMVQIEDTYPKAEFCKPNCKNKFNVYKSRNKGDIIE